MDKTRVVEVNAGLNTVQAELFPNVSIGDAPVPRGQWRRRAMSMSNRAKRMLQHQLRNRADAELNLIPMIDILSVMVAFLLVYSTEVEVLQNSKGIEIPQSISEQRPRQTVVVMLTKDDLFVQGERVASINDVRTSNDPIIAPLRDALKRPSLIGQEMTAKDHRGARNHRDGRQDDPVRGTQEGDEHLHRCRLRPPFFCAGAKGKGRRRKQGAQAT